MLVAEYGATTFDQYKKEVSRALKLLRVENEMGIDDLDETTDCGTKGESKAYSDAAKMESALVGREIAGCPYIEVPDPDNVGDTMKWDVVAGTRYTLTPDLWRSVAEDGSYLLDGGPDVPLCACFL